MPVQEQMSDVISRHEDSNDTCQRTLKFARYCKILCILLSNCMGRGPCTMVIEGNRVPLINTAWHRRKKIVNNAKLPYGNGTCYFNFFLQGDTGTIQAYIVPFGHWTRTEIGSAIYWTKVFLMFYSQYFIVNIEIQKWNYWLCYVIMLLK
jgi:hypothetical protein